MNGMGSKDTGTATAAASRRDPGAELDRLAAVAEDVVRRCRALGASAAEVAVDEDRGLSVSVRMGEVETIEYTRDRGLALTVYFGQRKGSASTADIESASIEATIGQACAIARYTEEDPHAGLADPARMADPAALPPLDLWHPWELSADDAIAIGSACEQAGREHDARIANSDGATVGSSDSLFVYANSHGFTGREFGTGHSISCSLIAGAGAAMQRDYWWTHACAPGDMEAPEAVGRRAAERTIARMDPRPVATGSYPVLFAPEIARTLVGHLVSGVSGGALYRRASFLVDHAGKQLFPDWVQIVERPHLRRGNRSAGFDSEGVATVDRALIRDGVLERYVLGSYSARKLGLESTANAGGVHNLVVEPGTEDFASLLKGMRRGLVVTELMGQGINMITGDYSRGAAGFWVENGEIAYPVDEVTVAGNLRTMFQSIEAIGRDVDTRSHVLVGSVLLGSMTVAGAG